MNDQQILWLIIALAVLILIVAIVVIVGSRRRARKREADRQEAERIRRQAARQQDLVASEAEAAESAQLEAQAAEERAQQLRAEAEERQLEADSAASALEAQLREADRKDPSVATDREGRRRDGTDPLEELGERDQPGSHVADQLLEPDGDQASGAEGERRVRRDVDDAVRRNGTGSADNTAAAGERPLSAEGNPAEESVSEERSDVADGRGRERGEEGGEDRGGSHAAGQ